MEGVPEGVPAEGARDLMEVAGLLGRAAVANGYYRKESYTQHNRPVYVQCWDSSAEHFSADGPARIVYSAPAHCAPAWIVEVPGDLDRAYACKPGSACTPDAPGGRDWTVWFCPLSTPIEDGCDLWYPASDFDSFRVGAVRDERPGSPLVRTHTDRTGATSDSLDSIGEALEGLEERVRYLDTPASQKTLIDLYVRAQKLDGALDQFQVTGLTGETPLRDRRKHFLARVVSLLETLDSGMAAARAACDAPQSAGRSTGSHQAADGAAPEPEPEPEPSGDFLVRAPSKKSVALDDDLEGIQLELSRVEERGTDALQRSEDAGRLLRDMAFQTGFR
jgi:hypothetical protein